jgi:hypothetical protein
MCTRIDWTSCVVNSSDGIADDYSFGSIASIEDAATSAEEARGIQSVLGMAKRSRQLNVRLILASAQLEETDICRPLDVCSRGRESSRKAMPSDYQVKGFMQGRSMALVPPMQPIGLVKVGP